MTARARCIRCSRRWSTSTARNAASARRASSWPVRALPCRRARPTAAGGRTTGSPAISAAAPATGRSSMRRSPPAPARRGDRCAQRRSRHRRKPSASSPTARTSSSATTTASSPRRPAPRAWPTSTRRIPTRRIVAGATDVGLWITKQLREPAARSSISAASPDLDRIDGHRRRASSIGAAATYARGRSRSSPRIDPDLGELLRRLGSQAGARLRHRRRQHRQRLADRRHAAGADRARRHAGTAPWRRRRATCRSRISSSTTASRTASRASSSRRIDRAEARGRTRSSAATRSPSASTRTSRRCMGAFRFTLDGTARSRRRGSPSAAWRRRRKRAPARRERR